MEHNRAAVGPRVLDDVRVLDFTGIIAGAYCTRMLADLGADVLKVEPPGGEMMRHIAPLRGDTSTVFSALNSGKRSLAMDLKSAAAADICKLLVGRYDVVVENFSPGVMQRLGLDYAALREENPALVMCSISGYGQTGPGAARPAYAPIVQAMSGYEMVTLAAQPGVDPPLNMGLPVGDTCAAQQAFGAICAALYYRARTGIGQYIDIAMFDSLLATMHRDFQAAFHPDVIDRTYGPIAVRDGYVMVMPLSQRQFVDLCTLIGRPDLQEDARFATMRARFDNYNELMRITETWSHTRTALEAVRGFEAAGIPCTVYRDIREAADDPQLHHRAMLTEVIDAAGPLKVPNAPFLYSATHAAVRPEVATLGQHTLSVLGSELGMPDHDIEALAAAGVIHTP